MPGVYISYPFCTQKCSFCNFASDVAPRAGKAAYEHALLAEMQAACWPWQPDTVYFGGGTPSLMPFGFVQQMMDAIPRQRLTEVTLECAPGTVTPEALAVWQACGINRLSLGVQSFITDELRQVGRRHDADIVEREIALMRSQGLANFNLDLIAGLPNQTRASWEISLDWVERLAPPHASVYIFEVDEDSRLGNEILLGGVRYGAPRIPGDELVAELYERAVERFEAMGLRRYEISNFARAGFESRHNLKYWQLEPYLGFGLDAHSFDGRQRWSNPDVLEKYLQHQGAPECSATDPGEEHFFVGLRLMDGIKPTGEEWSRFAQPIGKWLEAGMLHRDGERLRLSPSGVLVSNEIFQEFLHV